MKFHLALALMAGFASLFHANAQTRIATEVLVPQFIAAGTTSGSKLQSAYRLTLTGLDANATYRYFSGGSGSVNITTTTTAGAYFGIDTIATSAGFIQGYTSGKSLNGTLLSDDAFVTTNHYSQFLTTAAGTYTGWFSIVPTNNLIFNPGNSVYFYEQLNNGAEGLRSQPHIVRRTRSSRLTLQLRQLSFPAGPG